MSQTALETVGAPAIQTVGGHDADGDPAPGWTFDVLAGCGAVVSTPNDMLRYARANLNATPGTLNAALLAAQQPLRDADLARRIGYAWITQADGIVWHNGGTAGFRSFLGLDHAHGRAIVVLANAALDSIDMLGLHALDPLVPPPLPPQPDAPVDRRALESLVGTYRFAVDGSTCNISIDDRGLIATFAPGAFRARLHARSATEFKLRLGEIALRFNNVGTKVGPGTTLSIEQPGQPAQTATLTATEPHP
jgi:CubicO group peptidase (beta-lactamase class C family)